MSVANPLDALPLVIALRESSGLETAVRILHVLGFTTLAGTVIVFDLRVLGIARKNSVRALSRRLLPWTFAAIVVIVPTGSLLFLARAGDLIASRLFVLKMALIAAAAINAVIFRTGPWQGAGNWDTDAAAPNAARAGVALSIVLWVAVIACGKVLATR